jgi:hypothetical protein
VRVEYVISVVIADRHIHREWNSLKKYAGQLILIGPTAVGDIAGDNHPIRIRSLERVMRDRVPSLGGVVAQSAIVAD